jgi:hypothetical protein
MHYMATTPRVFIGLTGSVTASESDELLESLDTVDASFPASGVAAGSPTESESAALQLDVELDLEKARQLIKRFEETRRELDAETGV